jgi:hypothetical protein
MPPGVGSNALANVAPPRRRRCAIVLQPAGASVHRNVAPLHLLYGRLSQLKEHNMGKYVLAWALGVPGVIVVLAYLFFH